MFNITSKKDGTEPVVMALSRGIVTVGELAWAVKGSAAPERIRLLSSKCLKSAADSVVKSLCGFWLTFG